ncbi:PhoH family protein [Parvularcula bermudensis HTCC2503]|uniref:PhoH-like protein n=1 Tax=Parvularcula bermudensis (strain ATCC BAA-594 / HTCC2503 / KCTC 12087) TaxID=314260 RepID=E0TEP1_PARBH|nr:PhoH family protein [Parvularcula bermudensis]ADM08924.1 PhoH family protein [Parvularcula bermudensis HTCC2503]
MSSATVRLESNRVASDLSGPHDINLLLLENKLDVTLLARGNTILVKGEEGQVLQAQTVLNALADRLKSGLPVTPADIDTALRMGPLNISHPGDAGVPSTGDNGGTGRVLTLPRRTLSPRTPAQATYLETLATKELTFGVGPAGTGKTYLAVAFAALSLIQGRVERIILSRPAVEAGERIGFLPGDMKEKIDPYLRPLYDALYDVLHADFVDRRIAAGEIEIAPLAFMRGRTLSRAVVLLDEAQNTTAGQMKMFLTRLGEGSRMIVTGDPSQTDLAPSHVSGLADALSLLQGIDEVGIARFTGEDVVRHDLVRKILSAYDTQAVSQRPAAP